MDEDLAAAVDALLADAAAHAARPGSRAELDAARQRLQEPLRVAVAGLVKAGKSTLLNALLGEELAPTDAGECTQIVTWYRQGTERKVMMFPRHGPSRPVRFSRAGGIDVDLAGHPAGDIDRLEVSWPTPGLQSLTIIDTPGIASISGDVSERTLRVLTPEQDRAPLVDAVIYLLRHTHPSDLRFLESFHDDTVGRGTPVNTVGVLSRADEIGVCRPEAMEVAGRVAARYQDDPRLRRLCPVVVPVAGLLAVAGVTLRESEYRALHALAGNDPTEIGELLLTADRFAYRPCSIAVTELERQHLQQRLGLYGVRLAVDLITSGAAPDSAALSGELVRRSGLDRLHSVLARQFTERSTILKARTALAVLHSVLRSGGCRDTDRLSSIAEQITATAHAFEETRLLDLVRDRGFGLPADRAEELDLLFGGSGHAPATRLGLPDNASAADVRAAALTGLHRWRAAAEHPLAHRAAQRTARGAQRTLEGILAHLTPPGPPAPQP